MRRLALLAVPLALAGCGSGAVSLGPAPKPHKAKAPLLKVTGPPTKKPKVISLQVWFVQGHGLAMRSRAHAKTVRVATAAVDALLAGPTPGEQHGEGLTTAIPGGTRLLGIGIDRGVATVDLTSQFQAGGNSESLQLRLAQVVYTLTQFPTVRKVRFQVDGAPVLDRLVGRSDYGKPDCAGFPSSKQGFIAINSPQPGARVSGPGHIELALGVHGCSSTFEGGLNWDLKTKDGATVASGVTRGGSLRPGPFRFSVSPSSLGQGRARLEVYEPSASGKGRPTIRATLPVTIVAEPSPLTP